ncbi:MAG: Spy/CpxP family protein refolding chaperone [Candidatus Acidiferrales bacterium]
MRIRQKIGLMIVAAAISIPGALARSPDQGSTPPQSPNSPAMMHRQMQRRDWNDSRGRGPARERGREFSRRGMRKGMNRWGARDMMLARIARSPEMRQRLGITADQAAKIEQQTLDFRKTQIQGRADIQVHRVELASLLSADQPDRAAIDKELDAISASRLAQTKAAVNFHLAMRDALTPDQRQKLQQMRENFRRGGHMRPPRGPRGMGQHGGSQGAAAPSASSPDAN